MLDTQRSFEMTLDEAFEHLPHADRICEQQGECSCGRDEAITVIRDHLNAALELLAIREEQIGEFLQVNCAKCGNPASSHPRPTCEKFVVK